MSLTTNGWDYSYHINLKKFNTKIAKNKAIDEKNLKDFTDNFNINFQIATTNNPTFKSK